MSTRKEFSEWLRATRKKAGLNQIQMSQALGLPHSTYHPWEADPEKPYAAQPAESLKPLLKLGIEKKLGLT